MTARRKNRRGRRGLPWWTALIFAFVALVAAGWYFLIGDFEPGNAGQNAGNFSLDNSETLPVVVEQDSSVFVLPEERDESPSLENPWIALIIDDFGSPASARVVDGFLKLPFEVTFSIIPGNVKSISIGEQVYEAGGEVFIHLPMEPIRQIAMNERDMVLVGMAPIELETILDRVTGEIPYAVGINNHMGSKAMLDDRVMEMLAFELRKRSLVFVDSRTVSYSRGLPVMEAAGVPVLARDVFIDNRDDVKTIPERIDQLLRIAVRRGWAVGIAHARQTTLEALKEIAPVIEETGVRVVSASTLINSMWKSRGMEATSMVTSIAH